MLLLEGRPKSDLSEWGIDRILQLAEAKGYQIPSFEMDGDEGENEWIGEDLVWIIRNHPDHPAV